MRKNILENKEGQTAVEYIILLAVVSIMTLGIGRRVKSFVIGTGNCPGPGIVCMLQTNISETSFSGSYQYFPLMR